jgi:hypothetical protein
MPPVMVLDACVLYPAALWLAAGGTIRVHCTNEIHAEWMRNVERDFGVEASVLERVRDLMDRAAGGALIGRYRYHERLFPKTDVKDRHVAGAAVAARRLYGADTVTIVTWNIKDFDRKELVEAGLAAETPDAFLGRLLEASPEDVITAFARMRDNLRNPPKTTEQCVDTLAAQRLQQFALMLSARIG